MTKELTGPGGSGPIQPLGEIFLEGGGINFELLELPEDATMREIRQAVLRKSGKIRARGRKAESLDEAQREARKEERKATAKKRREEKNEWLRKFNLGPTPRGEKLSEEERKARRAERGKKRREGKKAEETELLKFAAQHKKDFSKLGLDPTKFKYLKF